MTILDSFLGKSFSDKGATCRKDNLDDPQFAAKYLYTWDKQYRLAGADKFARAKALEALSLHDYLPSNKISADVLKGYSPEKKLICDALEGIANNGGLSKSIIENLETLMDTGKVASLPEVTAAKSAEPAPVRL